MADPTGRMIGETPALPGAPAFRPSVGDAEVALGAVAGSRLFHLEGARDGRDRDAVLAAFGAAAVPMPGQACEREAAAMLGIGPATWLLILAPESEVPPALGPEALGRGFEAAVDMSHAWAHIAIAGAKATELLSKGSALDLHPRAFPPGSCAVAGFARFRTILWHSRAGARFDLFVGRSHAVALWHWLWDAAAEYRQAG